MKQLLFIVTALFILGCNSDDSKSDIDTNRQLKKITSYSLTGGKEEFTGETFFKNGREISSRYSNFDGEIIEFRNHYNDSGLLVQEEKRESSQEDFKVDREYTYDSKNRLVEISRFSLDTKHTRTFIYNEDNTISGEAIFGQKATYFLGESGLIVEQVTEFEDSEHSTVVSYENNLIKSLNSVSSDDSAENLEYSFEYEQPSPQKKLNIVSNSYGSNNNYLLLFGLTRTSLLRRFDVYLTKSTLNDKTVTSVYTFDSNGFIVREDFFNVDGINSSFSIYEYN